MHGRIEWYVHKIVVANQMGYFDNGHNMLMQILCHELWTINFFVVHQNNADDNLFYNLS